MKVLIAIVGLVLFFTGVWWYLNRDRSDWGNESENCRELESAQASIEEEFDFGRNLKGLLSGCL